MSCYRIFRMKENDRQRFRCGPHTAGATLVKPREYDEAGAVDAPSVYSAWSQLKDTDQALAVGDILLGPNDEMRILKYIGFEVARWIIPEVKQPVETATPLQEPASLQTVAEA